MQPRPLAKGEILQISPDHQPATFGGLLFVVEEPRPWGAKGYVALTGNSYCYIRMGYSDLEPTGGMIRWIASPSGDTTPGDPA